MKPWVSPIDDGRLTVYAAASIQAVARGEADDRQQQEALKFIVEVLCGNYQSTFQPDLPGVSGDRNSAFAEGKRDVGLNIVDIVESVDISKLEKQHKEVSDGRPSSSNQRSR